MIRPIKIKPVLNGFVVEVGCQVLAFDSRDTLLSELRRYLEYPKETEASYRKSAMNAWLMDNPENPVLRGMGVPQPPAPRDPPLPGTIYAACENQCDSASLTGR